MDKPPANSCDILISQLECPCGGKVDIVKWHNVAPGFLTIGFTHTEPACRMYLKDQPHKVYYRHLMDHQWQLLLKSSREKAN